MDILPITNYTFSLHVTPCAHPKPPCKRNFDVNFDHIEVTLKFLLNIINISESGDAVDYKVGESYIAPAVINNFTPIKIKKYLYYY